MKYRNQVIYQYKEIILIALAALVTSAFVVLRAAIGFGPILMAGLALYYLLWRYFRGLGKKNKSPRWMKYISSSMTVLFIAWLISFVIIEGAIIAEGKADKAIKGDYVLVLGAGLKGDVPSVSLRSRLEKAAEYLKEDKRLKVIVSGGQGRDESISEAEAMKRYLIQEGIEADRIIKEESATSTKENLLFSKSILDGLDSDRDYKVIIITSDYHVYRTKILAKGVGLEAAWLPSETPFQVYASGCVREYFALINTYLRN